MFLSCCFFFLNQHRNQVTFLQRVQSTLSHPRKWLLGFRHKEVALETGLRGSRETRASAVRTRVPFWGRRPVLGTTACPGLRVARRRVRASATPRHSGSPSRGPGVSPGARFPSPVRSGHLVGAALGFQSVPHSLRNKRPPQTTDLCFCAASPG